MDKVLILKHDTTWNMTSQSRGHLIYLYGTWRHKAEDMLLTSMEHDVTKQRTFTYLYGTWRHKAEDIWLTYMEHDVTKQRTFDLPLWNMTSQNRGHLTYLYDTCRHKAEGIW